LAEASKKTVISSVQLTIISMILRCTGLCPAKALAIPATNIPLAQYTCTQLNTYRLMKPPASSTMLRQQLSSAKAAKQKEWQME